MDKHLGVRRLHQETEEALEKFWINFKSKITQVVADILNQAAIEEAA